jgi:hypothetical protein
MTLQGESTSPSAQELADWADNWWAHEGVPALEAAVDDEGVVIDTDDPRLSRAFARSFVAAMKVRLRKARKKPKPSRARRR